MTARLLNAVYSRILTSTGTGKFAHTFSSRVYLNSAPADTILPLCVYTGSQLVLEKDMNGTARHSLRITFSMYDANNNSNNVVLAQSRLKTLLDGVVLAVDGYDRATCILREQGVPQFEDDSWSIEDEYELVGQITS